MAASSISYGENHENSIEFKPFDVVPEASDHYYLGSNSSGKGKNCFNDISLYSHIMKEWKIIKKNLPESIYVQAYENRIDLLSAVIIGSVGTPYHDGLFFFDIGLPSDYPRHPPNVYYHSCGHRLNPNLYASGKVCLSLINTWNGSKVEKWTKKSTILQVLVSIQGLVLNDRPYFNEPGFEYGKNSLSPTWIDESIAYNEDAFILSCKTMIKIMQKPPRNFEVFIAQHFRERGEWVLEAIKTYQNGHMLVGNYQKDGASISSLVKVSSKFKRNLRWVYNDLEKALALVTSQPNKKKLGNKTKEEEEASVSALESGKPKNLRPDEDLSSQNGTTMKSDENVKRTKNGLLGKLANWVMYAWENWVMYAWDNLVMCVRELE